MPKFGEAAFGTSGKVKKKSTLSTEQEELRELIRQGLEEGTGPYADIYGKFNEEEFSKGIKEPAMKRFQEETLPLIQEKFIGQRGSGARRSKERASVDLQSKLSELMYNAQLQQKQNRAGGVNALYNRQEVENIYKQPTEGIVPGAVKGFAEGVGKGAGAAIAG